MEDWLLTLGLSLVLTLILLYVIDCRRKTSFFEMAEVPETKMAGDADPKRTMEPPFEKIQVQGDMLTAVGLATYKSRKSIMDAPPPGAMQDWMDQQPKAPPVEYKAPAPAPQASGPVQLQPGQTAVMSQTSLATGQSVPTVTFQIPNNLAQQIASFQNEYVQQLGSNQDTPTARQQFIDKKTAQISTEHQAMADRAYKDWVAKNGPVDTADKIAKYAASQKDLQQKFDIMQTALQTLQQTWVPSAGPPPPPTPPEKITAPVAPAPRPAGAPSPLQQSHGTAPVVSRSPEPSPAPATGV
jgi:hypothetical protein